MTLTRRATVAGGTWLLLFLCGCGQEATVKLAPVTGRVMFKNQALTAIEVYFNPDAEAGNHGEMGSALVGSDGTFTMTTPGAKGPRDGVVPGAYKVTLGLGRRNEKELAPYKAVQTTKLTIEVPEGGLRDIVIDLDHGRIDVKSP
jgi:hypothetical protein